MIRVIDPETRRVGCRQMLNPDPGNFISDSLLPFARRAARDSIKRARKGTGTDCSFRSSEKFPLPLLPARQRSPPPPSKAGAESP